MKIELTKINNGSAGNPRAVIHFLALANTYEEALKIAKKIGGRKFHNRQFGGGIAFPCWNEEQLIQKISKNKTN